MSAAIRRELAKLGLLKTRLPFVGPRGARTVILMDSMSSQYHPDMSITTASYAAATGVLTLTKASHGIADTWPVDLFHTHAGYPSLREHLRRSITRIDADNFSVQLDPNLPDLPNGTLSAGGTCFTRLTHQFGSNSWILRVQQLLGWPFDIVANGAQSGDTTADVLARLDDYVLRHRPQVVIGQAAGINDFAVATSTVEAVWTRLRAIFDRLIEQQIFIIMGTVTPCRTPETLRVGKQNGRRVVELNRLIRQYLTRAHGIVLDHYREVVDNDDAEGEADTGRLKTNDGVHYSNPGAFRVARADAPKISPLFPGRFDSLPTALVDCYANSAVTASSVTITDGVATFNSNAHGFRVGEKPRIAGGTPAALNGRVTILSATANAFTFATAATGTVTGTVTASGSRNLFPNPILTTASGGATQNGITGTVASGLRARNAAAASITAVASVIAHPDGHGNVQQLDITACANTDLPSFYTEPQSLVNGLLEVGKTYMFECWARVTCADWPSNQVHDLVATLNIAIDGVTYQLDTRDAAASDAPAITQDTTLHLRTPAMKLTGVPTSFYGRLMLRPLAGGTGIVSSVKMMLGQINIIEVDDTQA